MNEREQNEARINENLERLTDVGEDLQPAIILTLHARDLRIAGVDTDSLCQDDFEILAREIGECLTNLNYHTLIREVNEQLTEKEE